MRIVWLSSWFGDYRVPVYDGLNSLSDGRFCIVCSEQETSELVREKLHTRLGDNAVILRGQKVWQIGVEGSTFANRSLEIRWQRGLYRSVKERCPDVVIVEGFGRWAPAGVLYALLHRKKLVMFYERTRWTERNAGWWRIAYRKFIGRFVDCFLTNGVQSEEYIREALGFKGTPIVKGCMAAERPKVNLGLADVADTSLNQKTPNVYKEQLHSDIAEIVDGNGLVFLFVGQMVERKGVVQLMKAWAKHHERYGSDRLVMAGDGVLRDFLSKEYSVEDGVDWMGYVSYDRMYECYAECDVVVMPTLEDNWSLVVPEAMSYGKAVMCSVYNGGCPELVKDGMNGFSFDPLDEEGFVETFGKFHDVDIIKMGREGLRIEAEFTPEKAAKRIYDACLGLLC